MQRWVAHASIARLDRVSFDGRTGGRSPNRTDPAVEDHVLAGRRWLAGRSDLSEQRAEAIRRELARLNVAAPPSVRTTGSILLRRGAQDGRRRVRRPPPPPG